MIERAMEPVSFVESWDRKPLNLGGPFALCEASHPLDAREPIACSTLAWLLGMPIACNTLSWLLGKVPGKSKHPLTTNHGCLYYVRSDSYSCTHGFRSRWGGYETKSTRFVSWLICNVRIHIFAPWVSAMILLA